MQMTGIFYADKEFLNGIIQGKRVGLRVRSKKNSTFYLKVDGIKFSSTCIEFLYHSKPTIKMDIPKTDFNNGSTVTLGFSEELKYPGKFITELHKGGMKDE